MSLHEAENNNEDTVKMAKLLTSLISFSHDSYYMDHPTLEDVGEKILDLIPERRVALEDQDSHAYEGWQNWYAGTGQEGSWQDWRQGRWQDWSAAASDRRQQPLHHDHDRAECDCSPISVYSIHILYIYIYYIHTHTVAVCQIMAQDLEHHPSKAYVFQICIGGGPGIVHLSFVVLYPPTYCQGRRYEPLGELKSQGGWGLTLKSDPWPFKGKPGKRSLTYRVYGLITDPRL